MNLNDENIEKFPIVFTEENTYISKPGDNPESVIGRFPDIDSKGKIRNIYDMTPFSLTPIKSTSSVRYALEVPQGWFEKENINVGDTVSW